MECDSIDYIKLVKFFKCKNYKIVIVFVFIIFLCKVFCMIKLVRDWNDNVKKNIMLRYNFKFGKIVFLMMEYKWFVIVIWRVCVFK